MVEMGEGRHATQHVFVIASAGQVALQYKTKHPHWRIVLYTQRISDRTTPICQVAGLKKKSHMSGLLHPEFW